MVAAYRREGEPFEGLPKRFRQKVQREKELSEHRQQRYCEKPSQARKRKAAKKLAKSRSTTRKMQRRND